MGHLSYEEQKKLVIKGLKILGAITIIEVLLALLFNGHIISSFHKDHMSDSQMVTMALVGIYGLVMISLSLYKARFIVYNFMHLGSEVSGLRWSVLMPMLLLVWAIIAFFQEGNSWKKSREKIKKMNTEQIDSPQHSSSYLEYDEETSKILI